MIDAHFVFCMRGRCASIGGGKEWSRIFLAPVPSFLSALLVSDRFVSLSSLSVGLGVGQPTLLSLASLWMVLALISPPSPTQLCFAAIVALSSASLATK